MTGDDELVPMELVGEDEDDDDRDPMAGPDGPNRTAWQSTVVAVAAAVGAVALCIGAWAEVGQRREAERLRCVQEAQLLAFSLGRDGSDPRDDIAARLADCGVTAPTRNGD